MVYTDRLSAAYDLLNYVTSVMYYLPHMSRPKRPLIFRHEHAHGSERLETLQYYTSYCGKPRVVVCTSIALIQCISGILSDLCRLEC